MSSDRDIQKAIEAGGKNRRTTELIHKWFRHAKVEKCGDTGLIEMQTGLPIGHHAMVCPHASLMVKAQQTLKLRDQTAS